MCWRSDFNCKKSRFVDSWVVNTRWKHNHHLFCRAEILIFEVIVFLISVHSIQLISLSSLVYLFLRVQGVIQSIGVIIKEEGVSAFWKGHVPAQGLSAMYGLVQFSSFEWFTRQVRLFLEFLFDWPFGNLMSVLPSPSPSCICFRSLWAG